MSSYLKLVSTFGFGCPRLQNQSIFGELVRYFSKLLYAIIAGDMSRAYIRLHVNEAVRRFLHILATFLYTASV